MARVRFRVALWLMAASLVMGGCSRDPATPRGEARARQRDY